jgi:hypothetical protein
MKPDLRSGTDHWPPTFAAFAEWVGEALGCPPPARDDALEVVLGPDRLGHFLLFLGIEQLIGEDFDPALVEAIDLFGELYDFASIKSSHGAPAPGSAL